MSSIIQSDSASAITPCLTFAQSYFETLYNQQNPTAGNALVVFVSTLSADSVVTKILDSYNNVYTYVPGSRIVDSVNNRTQEVWIAENIAQVADVGRVAGQNLSFDPSTFVVTATITGTPNEFGLGIYEIQGINGSTPVVGTATFSRSVSGPIRGPSLNGGSGAVYLTSVASNQVYTNGWTVSSPWICPTSPWYDVDGGSVGGADRQIAYLFAGSGSQALTFTTAGSSDSGSIVAIAFVGGNSNAGSPSNFLGSITVVDEDGVVEPFNAEGLSNFGFLGTVPSGQTDIFKGSVTVVPTVPPGAANPYLGHARVLGNRSVAAPSGQPNPALGQVVILSSVPAGKPDPWFGSVVLGGVQVPSGAPDKIVTASFLNSAGVPCVGATVRFKLSQPASSSAGEAAGVATAVTDDTGSVSLLLWANDELSPSGTYYNVTVKDPVFGQVLYENVVIAGTSPINLAALTPIYTK
jgi:hypothetical protein